MARTRGVAGTRMAALMAGLVVFSGCLAGPADGTETDDGTDAEEDPRPAVTEHHYAGTIPVGVGIPAGGGSWGVMMDWPTVDLPSGFDEGEITVTWSGQNVGGLFLGVFTADRTRPHHIFPVGTSPTVIALEADDPRIVGVESIGLWTDDPGVSAVVTWTVVFEFLVESPAQ